MKIKDLIIVKRSGQRVDFDEYKIVVAIKKAFDSVRSDYREQDVNTIFNKVIKNIEINYKDRKTINVEDIQDIIENTLKKEKHLDVYKSFSEYRKQRAASRQVFRKKQQHKFIKALEKILEDDSLKQDNKHKAIDLIKKYGQTIVKEFNKSYIIDNKYLRAHEEGYIFINDFHCFSLGVFSHLHIDLKNTLENENIYNFNNTLNNIKKEINGSLNIPDLDNLFSDYFLNSYKKTFKKSLNIQLKNQGFNEYVKTTKINEKIDREENIIFDFENYEKYIKNDIIKNIFKNSNEYAIKETKIIIKHLIKSIFILVNNKEEFSFSFGLNKSIIRNIINKIIIEVLKENTYNINIIFKLNKKSDYLNDIHKLVQKGYDISLINCLSNKNSEKVEYFKDGIKIFENIYTDEKHSKGRMVISSIDININRIALESQGKTLKKFYERLEENLELAKNFLLLVFEEISSKTLSNYNYLFRNNIYEDEKLEKTNRIRKVIKNGTILIGITGLSEASILLSKDGKDNQSLILKILKFINSKITNYSEESNLNFQIYETVNKDARKHFMVLDKSIFGNLKNVSKNKLYKTISENETDLHYLNKVEKEFKGGFNKEITVESKINFKKFNQLIDEIIDSNIGFVNLKRKGSEK